MSKTIWLNNYSTWYSLYWYIRLIVLIIYLSSHTRTGVVVLSIYISDLLHLRGYICLDITINFSLFMIRRWVVVYLALYLWTVSRRVVVYLAVYLWMFSRGVFFTLLSPSEQSVGKLLFTLRSPYEKSVSELLFTLWYPYEQLVGFFHCFPIMNWNSSDWSPQWLMKMLYELSGSLFVILADVVVKSSSKTMCNCVETYPVLIFITRAILPVFKAPLSAWYFWIFTPNVDSFAVVLSIESLF